MQELDDKVEEKYMVPMIPVRKQSSAIHHPQTAESAFEELSLTTGQDLNCCSATTSARALGHVWRSKGGR